MYAGKSMKEVEEVLHNSAINENAKGSFVMTSSTYWKDGKKFWSDIKTENICSTAELAQKAPVQIYIERLAARVEVTSYPSTKLVQALAEDGTTTKTFELSYVKWDSEAGRTVTVSDKHVFATIKGWNVNTLAKKSYGIKQIKNFSEGTGKYFNNLSDWNEGVRCFWSETATAANQATATTPELFTPSSYFKYNNETGTNKVYVMANTADPFLVGNKNSGVGNLRGKVNFARTYATKLLIGVDFTIVDQNATEAGNEKFDMMYWGGTYYTPEALCHQIAEWYNLNDPVVFVRNSVPETGQGGNDDVTNHNYNVTFFTKSANEGGVWGKLVDKSEVKNNNKIGIDPAQYWNGMGYYIVNISNDMKATAQAVDNVAPEMYGVMRNTIYSYALSKFVGLGTPIVNPDAETDVENPTYGETFVAAQLSILNWRVVNHNDVILQ